MLKQSINLIPARQKLYQAKLAFYLFLASLGMFFIASMMTYLIIRNQAFNPIPDAVPNSIATMGPEAYQSLQIPMSFWLSTVLLIVVSVALHRACFMVRRERQDEFRLYLIISGVAASIFVIAQVFGLAHLLGEHFSKGDGSMKIYGMSFTLSFIHALHVFGGMIFLGFVIKNAYLERYDHERHWTVDNCASYWHFLDVVWACMLITFVISR
jgi:heme/copper-type cytochrome/quinol oxidase subunit 3